MSDKAKQGGNSSGLSMVQVGVLRQQFGKNTFHSKTQHRLLHILKDIFREPMFILLIVASTLYFILGNNAEGVMMTAAIGIIIAISIYQEVRSLRAVEALKQFTEPKVTVMREGVEHILKNEDLVPGDIILLSEGVKVPADAIVLDANDCTINESIITGESLPVEKNVTNAQLYQGSTVNSGKCVARVTATGNRTVLGKIGRAIEGYTASKTLLQTQINKFVRRFALFGLLAFLVIFFVNYLKYQEFTTSLLFALTLAMSVVPEEIPVAFSSFMALGAHKMSRLGIISRQPQIIENLGAISVLCLDKTGTITENKMDVATIYDFKTDSIVGMDTPSRGENVLFYGVLASESNPFDEMEKAIWDAFREVAKDGSDNRKMIHEYPLEGKPPMMTHAYREENRVLVASKGAPERILTVCRISEASFQKIIRYVEDFGAKGYRVIAVASADHNTDNWPQKQDDFNWQFEGLIALYDPPKSNVSMVIKRIHDAKIVVKMITGDYPETAVHIARQVGIINPLTFRTGNEVINMNDDELRETVRNTQVFARMFPDAKLKVIHAIKASGDTVAMTGDGVNDGPALKAADIGIAMGKKGTEVARQASDLILTDDNLEKIELAVKEGRKIYKNLVKAIRYIISIHIPIILTASLPVIFNWKFSNIFSPIHIIFLEIIMGPTCSIFFEKEPVEGASISKGPRHRSEALFSTGELLTSILQGIIISVGVMVLYYLFMNTGQSIEKTRSMVFTTLILANVFLTFTNRSFTETIFHTIRYKNHLVWAILLFPAIFLTLLYWIGPLGLLFQLVPLNLAEFGLSLGVALATVMWFELYKMKIKIRTNRNGKHVKDNNHAPA